MTLISFSGLGQIRCRSVHNRSKTTHNTNITEECAAAVRVNRTKFEIEVEVNLRPTVGRPICPGVRHPSGTRDQFFFLLEISFRQLRVCYFVAPSLTRERVCNLTVQLLLDLARAVTLGLKSRRTHGHNLLSHLRLPSLEGQVPVFVSPRNRVAQLYPRHWVPFL
jgi:hypothetical protein